MQEKKEMKEQVSVDKEEYEMLRKLFMQHQYNQQIYATALKNNILANPVCKDTEISAASLLAEKEGEKVELIYKSELERLKRLDENVKREIAKLEELIATMEMIDFSEMLYDNLKLLKSLYDEHPQND